MPIQPPASNQLTGNSFGVAQAPKRIKRPVKEMLAYCIDTGAYRPCISPRPLRVRAAGALVVPGSAQSQKKISRRTSAKGVRQAVFSGKKLLFYLFSPVVVLKPTRQREKPLAEASRHSAPAHETSGSRTSQPHAKKKVIFYR